MPISRRYVVCVSFALLLVGLLAATSVACRDPWILIVQPGGDQDVSGTIEVKADVNTEVEWKQVEFLVDGVSIGADTIGPPFSIMWNTTRVKGGEHKLTAKGTLADGTVKDSEIVTVKTSDTT